MSAPSFPLLYNILDTGAVGEEPHGVWVTPVVPRPAQRPGCASASSLVASPALPHLPSRWGDPLHPEVTHPDLTLAFLPFCLLQPGNPPQKTVSQGLGTWPVSPRPSPDLGILEVGRQPWPMPWGYFSTALSLFC